MVVKEKRRTDYSIFYLTKYSREDYNFSKVAKFEILNFRVAKFDIPIKFRFFLFSKRAQDGKVLVFAGTKRIDCPFLETYFEIPCGISITLLGWDF